MTEPAASSQSPIRVASGYDTARLRREDQAHFVHPFTHFDSFRRDGSLVIAKDLLSKFQEIGLMDRAAAERYRDEVLAKGGSQDAAVLIEHFLGRPYSFDAFERWLTRAA